MDHPLHAPSNPDDSATFRFKTRVNSEFPAVALDDYQSLWGWSTTHIDSFWSLVWDHTGVIGDKGEHVVASGASPSENPPWFSDSRLNWAENLLHCRSNDKIALIEATEPLNTSENPSPTYRTVTYADLYALVADIPGDRVAAYASNCIENVAACLATAALGGIWVSAAADFGSDGVLERLEQVKPTFLFAIDAVVYNGKVHPHLPKVRTLLSGLAQRVHALPQVIVIRNGGLSTSALGEQEGKLGQYDPTWMSWSEFVSIGQKNPTLGRTETGKIAFVRLGFDAPLWILFSSGTTGRPKPIVHRAGGMLLQAKKEFAICGDLKPEDVFFYYTTTGWMMWNFLVSGLSIGCTLVLYDGSPLKDPSILWRMTDELKITVFGTSAKYLDHLSKHYKPREHHDLSTLKHIYSTGSPLAPPLFDYVYEHIHPSVLLGSITGGTDICSLFAGMNTALPVYRGEIQCRMLGMAVEAFSPTGTPSAPEEPGELVCTKPFPCMPLGFWPLPGYGAKEEVESAKKRFDESYFGEFEGVWYHGDHIIITRSKCGNGGGLVMLGRSDGVLNPGGIRFGSAEIYDVLDAFTGPQHTPRLVDYLAVGQKTEGGADERVILFVKLGQGEKLDSEFEGTIKKTIRSRRSARHVPARVVQVPDIPYTLNGKRVEVLVKKIINGAHLSIVNPSTLANPDILELYASIGETLRRELV
ncbi:acetoacetyl-CoA synthetase [Coprinellus micaceus]|uniref:Acetoacetyl-CoA synthetase n=1 Tax=Coprinellus micaceus TaxID=71717 RepID=A0A4Y7T9P7_COPMI|nr:acetoacetyl-CoA synthetase [Coprinellus micaceus]